MRSALYRTQWALRSSVLRSPSLFPPSSFSNSFPPSCLLSSLSSSSFSTSLSPSHLSRLPLTIQRRNFSEETHRESESHSSRDLDIRTFPPNQLNTFINICPQGFEDVITRFGSFHRVVTAGLYFAIPYIDQIRRVDMREMTLEIPTTTGITQDNVSVQTGGALYVQVVDSKKACFAARRPLEAVLIHAISIMRSRIGTVELDSLFHERKKLNQELVDSVSAAASKWGMEVLRYELTDVIPDIQVASAMDAQATAERRRRETILNAEAQREKLEKESMGQRQSYINIAEGERQKVVLAAEARRAELILEAEGRAKALSIIGEALQQPRGVEAMNFVLAQSYVQSISSGLGKSSTVFLQQDVTDVAKLMAQGMGILKTMSTHPVGNVVHETSPQSREHLAEAVEEEKGNSEERK